MIFKNKGPQHQLCEKKNNQHRFSAQQHWCSLKFFWTIDVVSNEAQWNINCQLKRKGQSMFMFKTSVFLILNFFLSWFKRLLSKIISLFLPQWSNTTKKKLNQTINALRIDTKAPWNTHSIAKKLEHKNHTLSELT